MKEFVSNRPDCKMPTRTTGIIDEDGSKLFDRCGNLVLTARIGEHDENFTLEALYQAFKKRVFADLKNEMTQMGVS